MAVESEPHCISSGDLIETLASFELFRTVDRQVLVELCPSLQWLARRGGEVLFEQGEPGDCVYLVVHGRLRASVADPRRAQDRIIGEIGRGETVGEMALLASAPRSASVRAIRDTSLIRISREALDRLVEHHPGPMLRVARLMVERYQRALDPRPAAGSPAALAVVTADDDIPVGRFAEALVGALEAHGTAARLTGHDYEQLEGAADRDVTEWLHDQEARFDRVVYEAGPDDSAWTGICLRQADVVLVLGRSGGRARPGLRALLPDDDALCRPRRELVLLYDAGRQLPSGTAEWLAHLEFDGHHHVDMREAGDLARLGRMLTGTAVGIVLGGGGARGFAHIGVLRALAEKGIPIDLIGGTSMGAFVGAQYACDWDWRTMLEQNRRAFVESGSLMDYTLPMVAVLAGRRFYRLIKNMFGERRIEDLRRPYYCVATNLTQGDAMVHRAGPLSRWVATSMAIPGMVPPVFCGGEIVVDGGLLNNLPADVMQRAGRGPVFAVSVSAGKLAVERDYPDCLSGWRVLWSRVNPFMRSIRVPNLTTILARSATLRPSPPQPPRAADIDLLFEPPVSHIRLLDWSALETLVDIGYRSALERLDQWQGGTHRRPQDAAVRA
ncbi:MAG: cyclic nucleotide-binding and patatin-like phospholipase domain-containing protein [Planctomycetota bacterium]|jgi:predicted acylesterase/phospholipase RssA/CRP-like cAMP-binding protein